jgi:hypothetical protein
MIARIVAAHLVRYAMPCPLANSPISTQHFLKHQPGRSTQLPLGVQGAVADGR